MADVVVGILTYKRPRLLEQALRAVEKLETRAKVRVIVADNDAQGQEGAAVVKALASKGYAFPLSSFIVPERGMTYGRNALVEKAFLAENAEFLALMDDDQKPEANWLEALLEMQMKVGADVVRSTVVPAFEMDAPDWVLHSRVYRSRALSDGPVDMVFGDGGVLLARQLLALLPMPWFDHRFALSGGFDVELFQRFRALGARFAHARQSIIHEVYPASRVNLRWALLRAYRTGNSDVLISLKHKPVLQVWCTEAVKIPGAIFISLAILVLAIGRSGRQVDALCKISRACGKVAALFGSRYDEYKTVHGR